MKNNKLRQVTDAIHGTIYLSELESEFISTPYFYRLHDIYQSSTVYMTYPSNRTKRYEHSLGTMEIASNMLFSAVSNADITTRKLLFKYLGESFNQIYNGVLNFHEKSTSYLQKAEEQLDELFDYKSDKQPRLDEFLKNEIKVSYQNGIMADAALDQFQLYTVSTTQDRDLSGLRDAFLYRCMLEAIRIVGLFHDVGHPPYSHVIEDAIEDIYKEVNNTINEKNNRFISDRVQDFRSSLDPFITNEEKDAYCCNMMMTQSSLIDAKIHERIGLALLQSAINEVIPERIKTISKMDYDYTTKRVLIMYDVAVVEMAMAILTEANTLFQSLHWIVDGFVDADRLDYVVRDSLNSGIDWGKVPYKRLIQSCRLFIINDETNNTYFVVKYPKKLADDITDLLVTRYKIYARINHHHRCVKTSAALKACVTELSMDYLKNEKCICDDICLLWDAIAYAKAGNVGKRVIQWNDSWLISVLHKALINLPDKEEYILLKENLEEILLNKKKYYSLIKRGEDLQSLINEVVNKMEISETKLESLKSREYEKLVHNSNGQFVNNKNSENDGESIQDLFCAEGDARDSLGRIEMLRYIIAEGDGSLLDKIFPMPKEWMEDVFRKILVELKEKAKIKNFQIYENKNWNAFGIPKHEQVGDDIYLYGDYLVNDKFDENFSLIGQLESVQKCVPYINIYIIPQNVYELDKVKKDFFNEAVNRLANLYNSRVEELFNKGEEDLCVG